VKKGQVVAEFDRQYMLLRLDDYQANLVQMGESIKALASSLELEEKAHLQSIAAAKAELDKARHDLKTIPVQSEIVSEQLKLAEQEAAARYKELLDEVKAKEISRKASLRISVLERDQYKLEVNQAIANADRMLLKASIDGITVMSTTFRGSEFSQFQAGDEVHPGQMFMRVVDPSSMIVTASLNQVDVESMRVGASARVRFDAYPDLELPGHVYAIAAMPKTGGARAAYVREVPVTIRLDRLDPRVVPDLSVSVDVVLEEIPGAVVAPRSAIFRDNGGKPYVFLQGGSGWEKREIELGAQNHVAAVVRAGLKPGDAIAAEPPPRQTR
jgi:multidrug resistance efflux pump